MRRVALTLGALAATTLALAAGPLEHLPRRARLGRRASLLAVD